MEMAFKEITLNFPLGIEMAGYIDRKGVSKGYADQLKAFVIDFDRKVRIFVFDLLGIPSNLKRLQDKRILIATHTHSAPRPSSIKSEIENLIESIKDLNFESVEKVIIRKGIVENICDFRDRESKNSKLKWWTFEFHLENEKFGFLIFNCHPTILGPENLLYSSDLAGGLRKALKRKFGMKFVYLNSCAGNISTRKTRKERSTNEINRLSKKFVEEMKVQKIKELKDIEFEFFEKEITFEMENKKVKGIKNKTAKKLVMKRKLPKNKSFVISFLKINDFWLVFNPFELNYDDCEVFYSNNIIPIGYSNDYGSYLVSQKSSYEYYVSPYTENSFERFKNFVFESIKNYQEVEK